MSPGEYPIRHFDEMKRLAEALQDRIRSWTIDVEDEVHTTSGVVVFGHRHGQPVVLKVSACGSDERFSGLVLEAFQGRGVLVLEHADDAVLLERLVPGRPLGKEDIPDNEATEIIAHVIGRMSPGPAPGIVPTVESWGRGFERYRACDAGPIPMSLVDAAHGTYAERCASQATTRLLHGDLHHHNVLFDSRRGWLAIDPKGVVGEPAYEAGAALRNPSNRPDLFAAPAIIRKRADCFAHVLGVDRERILAWAFAQAVLATIWEWEDDGVLTAGTGWIAFASAVRPMLQEP